MLAVKSCSASSAHAGFAAYSAYAPTKYAVRGLADTLRNEVGCNFCRKAFLVTTLMHICLYCKHRRQCSIGTLQCQNRQCMCLEKDICHMQTKVIFHELTGLAAAASRHRREYQYSFSCRHGHALLSARATDQGVASASERLILLVQAHQPS